MTDVLRRRAARVVLLDEHGRVLLIEGHDPAAPELGSWWITPGGGREGDETPEQAALREVEEETGLALTAVSGPIWARTTTFSFDGELIEQQEDFFTARVQHFLAEASAPTELERRATISMRWWSVDELEATDLMVFPENLAALVRDALREGR
jgi:8-oxo-dGTP pyrophosphatase MutT (NUDIX family)